MLNSSISNFHYLLTYGFRPKYFMMFLGLLIVHFQRQDYAFFSGVSATTSAAIGTTFRVYLYSDYLQEAKTNEIGYRYHQ
jgi:hypothetical protein